MTNRARRRVFALALSVVALSLVAGLPLSAEDVPYPQPQPTLQPPPLPCFVCLPNPLPTGGPRICYEVPCY